MEWLLGLAFLPILMCGLMCVGGMALAAVGLRRTTARGACGEKPAAAEETVRQRVRADR